MGVQCLNAALLSDPTSNFAMSIVDTSFVWIGVGRSGTVSQMSWRIVMRTGSWAPLGYHTSTLSIILSLTPCESGMMVWFLQPVEVYLVQLIETPDGRMIVSGADVQPVHCRGRLPY